MATRLYIITLLSEQTIIRELQQSPSAPPVAHTGHEPKLPVDLLCYTSNISKRCTASHTGWRLNQPCAWPFHSSHHAPHVLWSVNNNNNCVLTHTTSHWVIPGLNEFTSSRFVTEWDVTWDLYFTLLCRWVITVLALTLDACPTGKHQRARTLGFRS